MSEQEQAVAPEATVVDSVPVAMTEAVASTDVQAQEAEVEMVEKVHSQPKNVTELSDALTSLVATIDQQLGDGFQAGQDIPMIVTDVLMKVIPAVANAKKLGVEAKGNPLAFTRALANGGLDIADLFLKK